MNAHLFVLLLFAGCVQERAFRCDAAGPHTCSDGEVCLGGVCATADLKNNCWRYTASSEKGGTCAACGASGQPCCPQVACNSNALACTGSPIGTCTPQTANFMFVTAQQVTPAMLGGVEGADQICAAAAAAAQLPTNNYKALLATSTASAAARLGNARGWIRPDAKPFIDLASDFGNKILYPPRVTEMGTTLQPSLTMPDATFVVTGGLDAGGNTCSDWSAAGKFSAGDCAAAAPEWGSYYGGDDCQNAQAHLYCFGTDFSQPLMVTPAHGRLAFLSTEKFTPSMGRAAADALCQKEVSSPNFLALLSTASESAAARFDTSAGALPWVRKDGVLWMEHASDLNSGSPASPLNVRLSGPTANTLSDWVWVGGAADAAGDHSCANWTSAATTASGWTGTSFFSDGRNLNDSSGHNCSEPGYVYCLEK